MQSGESFQKKLLSLITLSHLDSFRIADLRSKCLQNGLISKDIKQKKAYQILFREVSKMVAIGVLAKEQIDKNSTLYSINKRVDTVQGNDNSEPFQGANSDFVRQRLEERKRGLEVDILTFLAESEEYKRLYQDLPWLKSKLESCYIKAREQSSKCLGQMKAIDRVLSEFPELAKR